MLALSKHFWIDSSKYLKASDLSPAPSFTNICIYQPIGLKFKNKSDNDMYSEIHDWTYNTNYLTGLGSQV